MNSRLTDDFYADYQSSGQITFGTALPFYLSGVLLLAMSGAGFWLVFFSPHLLPNDALQLGCLILAALSVPVSFGFWVWPQVLRLKIGALHDFSGAMCEANARLTDLEAIRREHYKSRMALESLCQGIQDTAKRLIDTQAGIESALRDHAAIEDELLSQRQEASSLRKQMDLWRNGLVDFYRLFERTLDSENELQPDYRRAVTKTLDDFSRIIRPLGLDPICPETGDEFNDRIHQAVGAEENRDTPPGTVLRCTKWGFRMGSTILEPAGVVLARPRITETQASLTDGEPSRRQ